MVQACTYNNIDCRFYFESCYGRNSHLPRDNNFERSEIQLNPIYTCIRILLCILVARWSQIKLLLTDVLCGEKSRRSERRLWRAAI